MVQPNQSQFIVKLIVVGRAGLQAGPYFLRSLRGHNIPVMDSWAVDHETTQYEPLTRDSKEVWRQRLIETRGFEQRIYSTARELGFDADTVQLDRPEDFSPNNRPPVIRCATNVHSERWWQDFDEELRHRTPGQTRNLIVVIVYNPDGPTSGSAALELARIYRSKFRNHGPSINESVLNRFSNKWVIGVELCTPEPERQNDRRNTVCGYLRRAELFDSMESEDDRPFDLSLSVDGKPPSMYGDVSFNKLDNLAAELLASLLDSGLTEQDPIDIIRDNLIPLRRCKIFHFRVGFHQEEVKILREKHKRAESFFAKVPILGSRRKPEYHQFAAGFREGKREPFRLAPPMDSVIETALLSQGVLGSAMGDISLGNLKDDIYNYLVDYHLNSGYKTGENGKFSRLMFFLRSHPDNNRVFRPDRRRLENLIFEPHDISMNSEQGASYESELERRILIDNHDDERLTNEIDFLGVAGPVGFEDMGNYKYYKDAFEQAKRHKQGQNELKECIAFPASWSKELRQWSTTIERLLSE